MSNFSSEDILLLYMKDIKKIKLLTPEEEKELASRGDPEAKQKLIEANLRFVVKVARSYSGQGVPFLDLIQEGNLGLMKAVDSYDPDKGVRFVNYAAHWIQQKMIRAITDQGRTIRIPAHVHETIRKMNKVIRELIDLNGRDPTDEEIAKKMKLPVEKIIELKIIFQQPVSLDEVIPGTDGYTFGEAIPDDSALPDEEVLASGLQSRIRSLLEDLSDRERKVLILRYGLEGNKVHTLEKISELLGVSKERVRRIEKDAIRKIKMNKAKYSL